MVVLLIGSYEVGLLGMLPNLTPILLTMGIMQVLDLPMELFTMFTGAIAIRLPRDSTYGCIHETLGPVRAAGWQPGDSR